LSDDGVDNHRGNVWGQDSRSDRGEASDDLNTDVIQQKDCDDELFGALLHRAVYSLLEEVS
jgi:hypothetical protein